MDATTLRSLFQAFYQVFPQGVSFANLHTGDLILIGARQPLTVDDDRMKRTLQRPGIRSALGVYNIRTPTDMLWYFALSRDEAVAAAGNARPNTDTNIISEVRLSALATQPIGDEDPYEFLRRNFHLDLIPYLGSNAADRLYAQADSYFLWNDMKLAGPAAQQLVKIDPVRGRGVEYERAWRMGDVRHAATLYAQHPTWPDRTHRQHAKMLAQQSRFDEARKSLMRIKDPAVRMAAYTELLP